MTTVCEVIATRFISTPTYPHRQLYSDVKVRFQHSNKLKSFQYYINLYNNLEIILTTYPDAVEQSYLKS